MKNDINNYPWQRRKRHFVRIVTVGLISFTALVSHATDTDLSIMFLGNSITKHAPAPAAGWTGNWGMAASAMEKDYVWQVAQQLPVKSVQTFNIAKLETAPARAQLQESMLEAARHSQLVVVQLGDNVKPQGVSDFEPAYVRLLASAKPEQGMLICLSTWYQRQAVDAITERACKQAGGTYIQIGDIHSKLGYDATAQGFSDVGVRSHPGDAGMAEIAKRIAVVWKEKTKSQ